MFHVSLSYRMSCSLYPPTVNLSTDTHCILCDLDLFLFLLLHVKRSCRFPRMKKIYKIIRIEWEIFGTFQDRVLNHSNIFICTYINFFLQFWSSDSLFNNISITFKYFSQITVMSKPIIKNSVQMPACLWNTTYGQCVWLCYNFLRTSISIPYLSRYMLQIRYIPITKSNCS